VYQIVYKCRERLAARLRQFNAALAGLRREGDVHSLRLDFWRERLAATLPVTAVDFASNRFVVTRLHVSIIRLTAGAGNGTFGSSSAGGDADKFLHLALNPIGQDEQGEEGEDVFHA